MLAGSTNVYLFSLTSQLVLVKDLSLALCLLLYIMAVAVVLLFEHSLHLERAPFNS